MHFQHQSLKKGLTRPTLDAMNMYTMLIGQDLVNILTANAASLSSSAFLKLVKVLFFSARSITYSAVKRVNRIRSKA